MLRTNKVCRRLAAAATLLAATSLVQQSAQASPGSQVTPTNYTTATLDEAVQGNHDRIKFQTKGSTIVRVQKLEFAPGGYTGFHTHPGVVIVAVQSGSVDLMDTSCARETKPAGSVFVEAEDHVHQAISPNGAVVYVTYIVPDGATPVFRNEAPVPFCATSL